MSLQIARFTSRSSPPEGPETALISAAGVSPLECFRRIPKITGYTPLSVMTAIVFLPDCYTSENTPEDICPNYRSSKELTLDSLRASASDDGDETFDGTGQDQVAANLTFSDCIVS